MVVGGYTVVGTRAVRAKARVYAPSHYLKSLACGWYGFGHTNRRRPGDLRGTPVGRKSRFRVAAFVEGGDH